VRQGLLLLFRESVVLIERQLVLVVGPVPTADYFGVVAGVTRRRRRARRGPRTRRGRRGLWRLGREGRRGSVRDAADIGRGDAAADCEEGYCGEDERKGVNPSHMADCSRPGK